MLICAMSMHDGKARTLGSDAGTQKGYRLNGIPDLDRAERITVAAVLAMLAATSIAALADPRTLHGVSVWVKPIKFNLSFALHVGTLTLFVSLLRTDLKNSTTIRWTMGATCTAVLLEMF